MSVSTRQDTSRLAVGVLGSNARCGDRFDQHATRSQTRTTDNVADETSVRVELFPQSPGRRRYLRLVRVEDSRRR
jgi:hypothetical protein